MFYTGDPYAGTRFELSNSKVVIVEEVVGTIVKFRMETKFTIAKLSVNLEGIKLDCGSNLGFSVNSQREVDRIIIATHKSVHVLVYNGECYVDKETF